MYTLCNFDYKAKQQKKKFQFFNPLSPNIEIQILQTDLYTIPKRISWENLIKDQNIFP